MTRPPHAKEGRDVRPNLQKGSFVSGRVITNLNTDTHFVAECGHMDNREGAGRVMCVHHDSQAVTQLRPRVLGCQLSIITMLYHNSIIDRL